MAIGGIGTNGSAQQQGLGTVRVSAVTDGTSNTALFGEKLIGIVGTGSVTPTSLNARRVGFQMAGTKTNDNSANVNEVLSLINTCRNLPPTQLSFSNDAYSGGIWSGTHRGTLRFNSYNHVNTPNLLTCDVANGEGGAPGGYNDLITLSSNHPGGVNVTFCDGSVKFIKDSISPQIWWALGSRNLGEVVSADSY